MKKSFDEYQLLEGSHGKNGSLWKGKDHLLVIEGKGFIWSFSEHYRRIDFKNIQALILVTTSRWVWMTLLLVFGVLLLGLVSWLFYDSGLVSLATAFGVAAGGVGLILLVHLVRGRTCQCFLQTAVQVLHLKALKRETRARKVIEEVESLCRQHQGEAVGLEDLVITGQQSSLPVMPAQAAGKVDWDGSGWVRGAGGMMVLWGLVVAAELWVPGGLFLLLDVMLGVVAFVLTTIGLVRVLRAAAPSRLKITMWVSLGMQILMGVVLYGLFIAAGVMAEMNFEDREAYSGSSMIEKMANFSVDQAGGVVFVGYGLGLVMVNLGVLMLRGGGKRKTYANAFVAESGVPTRTQEPPQLPGAGGVEPTEIPLQNESKEG